MILVTHGVNCLSDYIGFSNPGGISSNKTEAINFLLSYQSIRFFAKEYLRANKVYFEQLNNSKDLTKKLQELIQFIELDSEQKSYKFKELNDSSTSKKFFEELQHIFEEHNTPKLYSETLRIYCCFINDVLSPKYDNNTSEKYFKTLYSMLFDWADDVGSIAYYDVIPSIWAALAIYSDFEENYSKKTNRSLFDSLREADRDRVLESRDLELYKEGKPIELIEKTDEEIDAIYDAWIKTRKERIDLNPSSNGLAAKEFLKDYRNEYDAALHLVFEHYGSLDLDYFNEYYYRFLIQEVFPNYSQPYSSYLHYYSSEISNDMLIKLKIFEDIVKASNESQVIQIVSSYGSESSQREVFFGDLILFFGEKIHIDNSISKVGLTFQLIALFWDAKLSSDNWDKTEKLNIELLKILELGDSFWKNDYSSEEFDLIVSIWSLLAIYSNFELYFKFTYHKDLFDYYDVAIDNTSKNINTTKIEPTQNKDGCYIATSVYGSYDCPSVWTLRRFRDYYLRKSVIGRLFIGLYYKISPKMVARFGENKIFKKITKIILDFFIGLLKKQGYSDSPYTK